MNEELDIAILLDAIQAMAMRKPLDPDICATITRIAGDAGYPDLDEAALYNFSGAKELSGSEAVFGLAAWLSGRKESVTFGDKHDCASLADLCGEFCDANNLTEPVDGWQHTLIHPTP